MSAWNPFGQNYRVIQKCNCTFQIIAVPKTSFIWKKFQMQMDSANVLYGFCAQNAFQTYFLCIFCRPYSHPVRTTTFGLWTATFTSSENGPCRITVKLLKTCSSYHVNSETFCFVEKKVCPNKWKWSLSESRLILPAAVFSVNVDNALEITELK